MKIYRVAHRSFDQEHSGYSYHLTKTEAIKEYKVSADEESGDEIEVFDVAINKHDLITFLNTHCSYPDNG